MAARSLSALGAVAVLSLGAHHAMPTAAVVVERTGFGQESAGVGSVYSFGVVLVNRSSTRDAVGVTVSVNVFAEKGPRVIYGRDFAIKFIPAGTRFVVGDGSSGLGQRITRVIATVHVHAMQPKRRRLPPVSTVRLDSRDGGVAATIANPYSTAIDLYDASAYAVVFDRAGHLVAGGSVDPLASAIAGPATLAPGGYLNVTIPVSGTQFARVGRAEVSIDP